MAEHEIGVVTHYFGKIGVAALLLTDGVLRVGDAICIVGHTTDIEMTVSSMQIEHRSVSEATAGQEIGILVPEPVRQHDKVYTLQG